MTAATTPVPYRTAPLAQARELAPAISARALEIEQARALPTDLVSRLRDAGLCRLTLPVALGGSGIEPRTLVEVVEEVCRADGATGWHLLSANVGTAFLAWLAPEAARRIVADSRDILVAGGQACPGRTALGEAVEDGDGYRLTGRWPFGSGCRHASWFVAGFRVRSDGRPPGGVPETLVAVFPAAAALGVTGTGGHDIIADGLRVPAEHTSAPYVAGADHVDPLFRLTADNLVLTVLSGFPLGVARRALDEVRAQLAVRPRPGGAETWLDDPAVRVTLMQHEVMLCGARRQVFDTLDQVVAGLTCGEGAVTERARLAAAVLHAYDTGRDAVLDCFRLAGTGALFDENPLQRCLRDLVSAAQHVAFAVDRRERVATGLLGLRTDPAYVGF